jgi:hypothetical protein
VANSLGAKTGQLDATSIGHPGKYTLCFAEDPPEHPWQPLRVQLGFAPEDTTVTIMATEGPHQIAQQLSESPEDVLLAVTGAMKQPSQFISGKGGQCVVILGYEHANAVRRAGWSQQHVRRFLVEHSRISLAELAAAGIHPEVGSQHDMTPAADGTLATFADPDDIVLVTAGGPGAGWSAYLPSWAPPKHSRSVTRRVRPVDEAIPDCGDDDCVASWRLVDVTASQQRRM